ncbi:MAG: HNH endonuclease [Pseudomonadota bacterium]
MGVKRKEWFRPSRMVQRDKRWPALRLEALRRDGFKCVSCGAAAPLEVDHIKPVRTHPELGFELSNLQTLCRSCHTRKTREDLGAPPENPERRKWRELLKLGV